MASPVKLYPFWGKDRATASSVWEHFGFQKNIDNNELNKNKACCKYCLKSFAYSAQNGTSSLRSHFIRNHQSLIEHDNKCVKSLGVILKTHVPDNTKHEQKNTVQVMESESTEEAEKIYSDKSKNMQSVVWEYFGFKKTNDQELDKSRTYCRLCSKSMAYYGGTSSMITHLIRVHSEIKLSGFQGCKREEKKKNSISVRKQTTLKKFETQENYLLKDKPKAILLVDTQHQGKNSSKNISKAKKHEFTSAYKCTEKQDKVSESIVNFLAQDMVSANILLGVGFKNMIATLDPEYKINSSQFYQDQIKTLYNSKRSNIEKEVAKISYGAITIELWPSPTEDSDYLSVWCHFVSSSWKLFNVALQTVNIRNNQDSIIAVAIQNILSSWKMFEISMFAVTCNNPNVQGALSETIIQRESITCFGDIINHAVGSVMNDSQVSRSINSIQEICRNFATHKEAALLLKDLCHDFFAGENFPETLPNAQASSWSDKFKMLEDFQKFEAPLKKVYSESASVVENFEVLTEVDWMILNEVIQVISPFYRVVDSLCNEQNPTASIIVPIINQLQDLLKPLLMDSKDVRKRKNSILDILENSYQDESIKDILFIATVIDPRFKTLWFLSDSERNRVYKNLTVAAVDITEMKQDNSSDEPLSKVIKLEHESTKHETEQPKGLATLFGVTATAHLKEKSALQIAPEKEVNQYREENQLAMDGDPFAWWRDREVVFPILSQIAKKYLCIPAFSLLPEILFTKIGETYKNKRSIVVTHSENPEEIDHHLLLFNSFHQ